jgi:ribosomal protein L25 (general stress protein Ctc)
MNIIGDVAGKTCVLVDDIVDTAGTLCAAAAALKDHGAQAVVAYCTHPVLSGPAIANLENSQLDELVVTDTIPLSAAAKRLPAHPAVVGGGVAGRDDPSRMCVRRVGQLAVRRLISGGFRFPQTLTWSRVSGNAAARRSSLKKATTMATQHEIKVTSRKDEGKGASRRLRRASQVPAILSMAAKAEPVSIQLVHNDVWLASQHEWFYSSILRPRAGRRRAEGAAA